MAEPEALASIARLANGGMRDAQSILDQMISFSGKKVTQAEVLEVYGLASPEQIQSLATGIAGADYDLLLRISGELSDGGLDLHRALIDLQDLARESLVAAIRAGGEGAGLGVPLGVEAHARILDALRAGEERVQRGLSDKVNFETTLFKATEAGRSRAIDGLIREISSLATAAGAKKKIIEPAVPPEPESSEGDQVQELVDHEESDAPQETTDNELGDEESSSPSASEEPEEESTSSQVEKGQNSMPEGESPPADENEELQSKVECYVLMMPNFMKL